MHHLGAPVTVDVAARQDKGEKAIWVFCLWVLPLHAFNLLKQFNTVHISWLMPFGSSLQATTLLVTFEANVSHSAETFMVYGSSLQAATKLLWCLSSVLAIELNVSWLAL